jgi:hypothetical protein
MYEPDITVEGVLSEIERSYTYLRSRYDLLSGHLHLWAEGTEPGN